MSCNHTHVDQGCSVRARHTCSTKIKKTGNHVFPTARV